ncbi:hypothetical protein B0A50_02205 [Salinomyces thailandicus]|uniref:Uncharacterized protein n=1 Tax=Salinomyces thailandicus TaxID=706561 RepID=A0A4U0U7X8_9PEZI|nr:hypothetical protein B0A50_02205 [Salinomyces thailandica]
MRLHHLSLLAALSAFAYADVEFTQPKAGSSQTVGTLSMKWQDSGDTPSIDDLTTYQIFLMVGGNDAATMLQLTQLVASGDFSTGNTAQATVQAGLAGSTANGYFLKMISVASEGGTVINYSKRFSITGMTGTTPDTYANAVPDGTDGPDTEDETTNDVSADTAAAGQGAYTIPYNLQSGLTKYAPMQPIPPTKITKNGYSRLYPTSSVSTATTWLPQATILTTMTASQTFKVSSIENTASPVSNPNPDMAKYLNRWKD